MKKLLKALMWLVIAVLVLAIGFVAFLEIRGIPSYPTTTLSLKIESTPEKVANGEKIAAMLCNGCHLSTQTNKVTGRLMLDLPKEFGTIHSFNITQDKEYGIGKYSDAELVYLLRTGIKRDGSFNPVMPKFAKLSDYDIESIVSYLHSDRPEVQANNTPNVECDYSLLSKFLCLVAFKPSEYPDKPIANPDTTNLLAYGKYLCVDLYACYACHSADFKTLDYVNPEKSGGFFGGGNHLLDLEGRLVLSANITPDEETGIGNWSLERFDRALRSGLVQDGPALRYPMMPHARLSDLEVKAIYSYLKTVPKLKNKVERHLES